MNTTDHLIALALKEDIGRGDITGNATLPKNIRVKARIVAKETIIVAGVNIAAKVFKTIDKKVKVKIKIKIKVKDGKLAKKGAVIATIDGSARSILAAERTALNFLQHLSGIATLTNKFVRLVKGTGIKILDTRKTTPGWRHLEKYAVKMGGGQNHRFGLYDMCLIKNNHIDIAGSVTEAVLRIKACREKNLPVEVEVRNSQELQEAVSAGADIIMLDNFSPAAAKKAVREIKSLSKKLGRVPPKVEISGNITEKNVRAYAKTGADFISIGGITHSAPAADIHMSVQMVCHCEGA